MNIFKSILNPTKLLLSWIWNLDKTYPGSQIWIRNTSIKYAILRDILGQTQAVEFCKFCT
jgi:hypothetical protein